MTREHVFEVVKDQIVRALPHVSRDRIQGSARLRDLGADSIDRADISTMAMETLNVSLPLVELGKVENIDGLVDLLHGACGS